MHERVRLATILPRQRQRLVKCQRQSAILLAQGLILLFDYGDLPACGEQ
jgi:hypothetical protein